MKSRTYTMVLLTTLSMLMTMVIPSIYAADNWYAYLYNETQHEIIQVSLLDGNSVSYDLGVEATTMVTSSSMGFSNDGRLIAFCAMTIELGSASAQTQFIVRDIASRTNLTELDLGQTLACHLGNESFSSDNTRVAVGVAKKPQDVPAADGRIWDVAIVDIANGQIVHDLNPTLTVAVNAGLPTDMPILAEVRGFDGDTVTFAAMPFGVGGIVYGDVYSWQLTAGTLDYQYSGSRSNASLSDYLPDTGETVWLDEESTLATVDIPSGPMGRFNVVRFGSQYGSAPIIYHAENGVLGNPTFIAGGDEGLALLLFVPENGVMGLNNSWIHVNREGIVTQLNHDGIVMNLVDAPGGYATLQQSPDSKYALLHHVIGNPANVLWTSEYGMWEMVWSSPVPTSMDMPSFPIIG